MENSNGRSFNLIFSWFYVCIGLLALLCSCASVGNNFSLSDTDKLPLGTSRTSEVISLLGKPTNQAIQTTTDGDYEVRRYNFAKVVISTGSAKLLLLEFKNDKLNAYLFASSFDEDRTVVDFQQIDRLRAGVGKLDKVEVLAMMGKPDGKALCPSTLPDFKERCPKATEIWSWAMADKFDANSPLYIETTLLCIMFDANDKISSVEMEDGYGPFRHKF